MSQTKLSVNVNKVALLRNSREGDVPSVLAASRAVLDAGAVGVTVHPRPDERHIRPHDVHDIAELLRDTPAYHGREFNIEGNPMLGEYMDHCRAVCPTQATLVPDTPGQKTSDHGYVLNDETIAQLKPIVEELQSLGSRVSLFMDPDPKMIERVPETGADRIELYTEGYAVAYARGGAARQKSFELYKQSAVAATDLGLALNAGHDLNTDNLPLFVTIPNILEVSIGHALIADALELGLSGAVRAYLRALQ